jgi:hypothetical protein
MDIILNELQDNHETNATMWIYKDNITLFNQFNQISSVPVIQTPQLSLSPQQQKKEEEVMPKLPLKVKEEKQKNTPLELIIKHTSTTSIMKNEIKQKLIDLITIPEFSKAFGVKKSAEIISAITRDSWNQSMALFISFMLDANIIYKDKSYLFNKEKNLQDISILVN